MTKKMCTMCAVFALSTCADGVPPTFPFSPEAGRLASFAEVFEVVDTLILEENPAKDVVTATPLVRFDGRQFWIADVAAHQAKVYAMDGSLLDARGRAGQGPGEFAVPFSARPARGGGLLVADLAQERLTLFSPNPESEPETMATPIAPLDAIDLGNRRYLVTGFRLSALRPDTTQPMLHVWNADSQAIERSFFVPPRPDYLGRVASRGEYVYAAIRDRAIWVVSAFTDSAFVLGMDGTRMRAIPFPLAKQPPPDAPERWEVDKFFVLANGCIAVEVGIRIGRKRDVDQQHLMILDGDGNPRALLADTPMLRVVADDLFYFQNPDRMEPNHWIIARWRAS